MNRRFVTALVSTALLLVTYFWVAAAGSLIWSRYSRAAELALFRSGTGIVADLAAVSFFIVAVIIGIVAALTPAARWRKLLFVMPIYLIGFLLTGVLLYFLQIGTVGSFTSTWIYIGSLSSAIAAIIVAVRVPLRPSVIRPAMQALVAASVLGALTWAGFAGIAVIVMMNVPAPPPAGGAQADVTPLLIGVAVSAIFAIVGLVNAIQGLRTAPAGDAQKALAAPNYRAETGPILLSCAMISIIGLAIVQFVPVARVNAKADNGVVMKWDSPETQIVVEHACADCHTNQTKWPWYSYVAPASWLTIDHVEGGRNEINFDALNEMPARRAANTYKHFQEQMKGNLMPPADYMLMHPEARLTAEQRAKLLDGLLKSTLATLPNQNK